VLTDKLKTPTETIQSVATAQTVINKYDSNAALLTVT